MTINVQKLGKYLFINVLLGIIGVGVSIYSIIHHIELKAAGVTDAACNINQTISCDAVAGSQYSEILGIPLGAFGLAYFLSIFLLSMMVFKSESNRESNISALATLTFIGGLVSIVLASISFFAVKALCLTCLAVYILTLGLVAGTIFAIKNKELKYSLKASTNGLTTAAIISAAVLIGYSQLAPGPDPSTHPNFVQDDSKNAESAPQLSTEVYNLPVNMTAYSGYGEDFRKGSDQAKVTIVEFADFECPACSRVSTTMNDIAKKYGPKVNIVFKNYPLDKSCNDGIQSDFHKHACRLAILARCAGERGKFWQYHDLAFQSQKDLAAGVPEKIARSVGLSSEEIKQCLSNKGMVDKIKDDILLGNQAKVQGTPSIYINGRKFLGNPNFYSLSLEIEKQLNN